VRSGAMPALPRSRNKAAGAAALSCDTDAISACERLVTTGLERAFNGMRTADHTMTGSEKPDMTTDGLCEASVTG
jgi:hypothetical protein